MKESKDICNEETVVTNEKLGFKDLLALTIAGIEVVLPYVIILVVSLTIVLKILTKFCIK